MTENKAVTLGTPWATTQELDDARPLFEQYYAKNTLPRTMEIMSEHGIKATLVQSISQPYWQY